MNVRLRCVCLLPPLLLSSLTASAEGQPYGATNLWSAHIGWTGRSSPALGHDGAIYIGSWLGQLFAFKQDGSQKWSFKTGFEIASSPAISTDETIYFGCRDGKFYAINKQGKLKWSFKTGGWVDASAAVAEDDTLYFGSWDKQFYAFNRDGSKKWSFKTGGPIVSSAAIGADGTIYFGSHDGKFYALNPDGAKRWEFITHGAIISSPAIGKEGEIYFTSVEGKFYILNPDGTRRLSLQTGGISSSSPVFDSDGMIYISINETHCAIFPDGKFKWKHPFWNPLPNGLGESTASVLANDTIVFIGGNGLVMTLPANDGDKNWIWNSWLVGPAYSSPLVATDGTVYVATVHGYLNALRCNVPLAESSWPMFRADPQHTGRVRKAR